MSIVVELHALYAFLAETSDFYILDFRIDYYIHVITSMNSIANDTTTMMIV